MFQLKQLDALPTGYCMVIAFDYPFGVKEISFKEEHPTKNDAMLSFSSNANTVLDVRIEEFARIMDHNVIQHFKYQKCYPYYIDMQYLGFYWDWKAFLEQIAEKRNHRHGYAKAVKDNIFLFQNLLPQYKEMEKYKEQLSPIITEIVSICKQIMEVSTKIQKELYGDSTH